MDDGNGNLGSLDSLVSKVNLDSGIGVGNQDKVDSQANQGNLDRLSNKLGNLGNGHFSMANGNGILQMTNLPQNHNHSIQKINVGNGFGVRMAPMVVTGHGHQMNQVPTDSPRMRSSLRLLHGLKEKLNLTKLQFPMVNMILKFKLVKLRLVFQNFLFSKHHFYSEW